MKIRGGFVSNSSSSSFVIGINEKISSDLLNKIFCIDKSPLKCLLESIPHYIVDNSELLNKEEFLAYLDLENREDENKIYNYYSSKYKYLYEFSASSEDGGVGELIRELEDEELIVGTDFMLIDRYMIEDILDD